MNSSVATSRTDDRGPRRPSVTTLITWLSGLASVLGVLITVLPHSHPIGWGAVVALLVLASASGRLAWRLWRRPVPTVPGRTEIFQPLGKLDPATAWPRTQEVIRICSAIDDKSNRLPLIVGASGAGKTVLLDVLVRAAVTARTDRASYRVIPSYDGERQDVRDALKASQVTGDHLILVLDQFEQWLARLGTLKPEVRADRQQWLRSLIEEAKSAAGFTMVLSVRAEWYYELRFLGNLLPSLSEAVVIEGASIDEGDDLRNSVLASFEKVVGGDVEVATGLVTRLGVAGAAGGFSPLEAQLVGATVERERVRGARISLEQFDNAGGVAWAVEQFFDDVVRGAPSRRICLKVLCAFSVETRFRQQLDRTDLGSVLFDDDEDVREAVKYLAAERLLDEPKPGQLDLAHDFFAAVFRKRSAEELHPTERDNVVVLAQAVRSGTVAEQEVATERRRLGKVVLALLVVIMGLRLLYFGVDWTLLGRPFTTTIFGGVLDVSYIPTLVAEAGWLVYGARMYDGVFRRLREPRPSRALSIFTLVALFLAAVLGTVWPSGGLLTIPIGGALIGLKLRALAGREDLNSTARHHLRVWAWGNLFLALYVGFLGAAQWYLSAHVVHTSADQNRWLAANAVVAGAIVASSWALAPVQVSRSSVSQFKGLIARPKGSKLAAAEGSW